MRLRPRARHTQVECPHVHHGVHPRRQRAALYGAPLGRPSGPNRWCRSPGRPVASRVPFAPRAERRGGPPRQRPLLLKPSAKLRRAMVKPCQFQRDSSVFAYFFSAGPPSFRRRKGHAAELDLVGGVNLGRFNGWPQPFAGRPAPKGPKSAPDFLAFARISVMLEVLRRGALSED
jgi:hypothetical protein